MSRDSGRDVFRTTASLIAATAALACCGIADAGLIMPVTVDDFSDTDASWPIEVMTGQTSDGNNETGLTGVLGDNRSTTLGNGVFGTTLDRAAVTIAPSVQNGVLDYSSTLFASSNLTLVYGNNAPAFDFNGQGGIVIDFIGFDFPDDGPLEASILLTSNGESRTASTMIADSGSGEVFISFDDLTPLRGSFSLSEVDALAIQLAASAGSDYRIGAITTRVPGPGALALLGAGVICLRRRRRR